MSDPVSISCTSFFLNILKVWFVVNLNAQTIFVEYSDIKRFIPWISHDHL